MKFHVIRMSDLTLVLELKYSWKVTILISWVLYCSTLYLKILVSS
jgi:hypothetical protein